MRCDGNMKWQKVQLKKRDPNKLGPRNKSIANLSRVDPAFVSTGLHGKKHFHRVANDQPLLFTSVVIVDQCYLAEGRTTTNGKLHKLIKGTLLEGEFERFVGAIGMITRERHFMAQLYKDALDFSTLMDFGDKCMFSVHFLVFVVISLSDFVVSVFCFFLPFQRW